MAICGSDLENEISVCVRNWELKAWVLKSSFENPDSWLLSKKAIINWEKSSKPGFQNPSFQFPVSNTNWYFIFQVTPEILNSRFTLKSPLSWATFLIWIFNSGLFWAFGALELRKSSNPQRISKPHGYYFTMHSRAKALQYFLFLMYKCRIFSELLSLLGLLLCFAKNCSLPN